jgi:hypothetical protein
MAVRLPSLTSRPLFTHLKDSWYSFLIETQYTGLVGVLEKELTSMQ